MSPMLALAVLAPALAPVPKPTPPAAPPVVHAVGVYEGAKPRGLPAVPFVRPGFVTVKVDPKAGPVVLVLSAYGPVNWVVDAPPGTVARVIATGYHAQTVTGVDARRVETITHDGGRTADAVYAYKDAPGPNEDKDSARDTAERFAKLKALVKGKTGAELKSFRGAFTGGTFELP